MTTRWTYNHDLTLAENRRRAIALHERTGPMVTATAEDGAVLCWYFPDGAVLDNDAQCMPVEPEGPPDEGRGLHGRDAYLRTLRNVVRYWALRVGRAERDFNEAKARAAGSVPVPGGGTLSYGPPTEADLSRLEELRDDVLRCRELHGRAQADLKWVVSPTSHGVLAESPEVEWRRARAAGITLEPNELAPVAAAQGATLANAAGNAGEGE